MAYVNFVEQNKPITEWKGWIRNRATDELEWCIVSVTAGLMGVFHDPEADSASIVMNLADFHVKPLYDSARRGSKAFTYADDCYTIRFVSKRDPKIFYSFATETEPEFKTWFTALTGEIEDSSVSADDKSGRETHHDARRMDSGLGDDMNSCNEGRLPGTRDGTSYKNELDAIEETELTSNLESSSPDLNARATARDRFGKSESSDSQSDSVLSNDSAPDSEKGETIAKLRPNAHRLRLAKKDSRFSAPVGDFVFWEEGADMPGAALIKTYSLPMRSPSRKRISSEGEDIFEYYSSNRATSLGREALSSQDLNRAGGTPTDRIHAATSLSDPARKKLGNRMTVKASKLVGRVAHLRSTRGGKTPLPRSSLFDITIEGELLRKHKSSLLPCFCALSGTTLYCYKSRESEDHSDLTLDISKFKLSKLTAATSEAKELDCAFVLTHHHSGKEYMLIAKDLTVARKWYSHLEEIVKNTEARQKATLPSPTPSDRRTSPTLGQRSKYSKSKYSKGSTFKKLARTEEEKRNSIAARMSRASFEDGYGFQEARSSLRAASYDDITNDNDDCDEPFVEITMEDILKSREETMGDPAFSRSMDDIGLNSKQASFGKAINSLGLGKVTPKTKRKKRTAPVPASEVENPVKSGYLETKKSGSWKRCWAVLSEDRLYLYRKPSDPQTLDIIVLDGYTVSSGIQTVAPSKGGNRYSLVLHHLRFAETQFSCDSLDDQTAWMAAIQESCDRAKAAASETNLDSSGAKLSPSSSTLSTDAQSQHSDGNGATDSSSDVSSGSPIMERKKMFIETKYERVKEAEQMEMLRKNTILNQRRMSADVKINAVEKQLLQQRKQRKRKKNVGEKHDEEEAFLEQQMEQLKARLKDIEKESQETTLQQEEKFRALKNKKEVEIKILEQERKLQKHRKAAQQALQQIVKGIITPPIGGAKPRFDLISEEGEDGLEDRKLSLGSTVGSVGISSSDSMGSLFDPRTASSPVIEAVDTPSSHTSPRTSASRPPRLSRNMTDSSTDSSSSSDSPSLTRHNLSLDKEFDNVVDVDFQARDKSKSLDSGFSDVVDVNANKASMITAMNGQLQEVTTDSNQNSTSRPGSRSSTSDMGPCKPIRTEVSEEVLRDIEEFEKIARRALAQLSWMV